PAGRTAPRPGPPRAPGPRREKPPAREAGSWRDELPPPNRSRRSVSQEPPCRGPVAGDEAVRAAHRRRHGDHLRVRDGGEVGREVAVGDPALALEPPAVPEQPGRVARDPAPAPDLVAHPPLTQRDED